MSLRALFYILILAPTVFSGCASNAPSYSPSIANIDVAGKLPASIAVGKFDFKKGEESSLNRVGARAASFTSPVNGSYADYLAEATKAELKAAGKLNDASTNVLSGTIEKNDLSAAGINTNNAEVVVRFKLQDGAKTNYEKSVSAKREWESSFLGGYCDPACDSELRCYLADVVKQLVQRS